MPIFKAASNESHRLNEKGLVIPLLLVLMFLVIGGIAYYFYQLGQVGDRVRAKSELSQEEALAVLKSEYTNPFDQQTQYTNPFDEYKNPFDSIK